MNTFKRTVVAAVAVVVLLGTAGAAHAGVDDRDKMTTGQQQTTSSWPR